METLETNVLADTKTAETTIELTTAANEAASVEQSAIEITQSVMSTLLGTATTTADGVFRDLEDLEGQRKSWEGNQFAASHRRLYAILTRCYAFYLRMKSKSTSKEVRASMRKGLDNFISSRGLKTLKDTHDMNRVVKAVFGEDRRRVSAYAAALKVALAAGPKSLSGEILSIDPRQLATWITEQGGIEEIRKAKSEETVPIGQRIAVAQAAVQAAPLTSFKPNSKELAFNAEDIDKPQVLIATYRPNGELEINCVIKSPSVISSALAFYYAKNKATLQEPIAAEAHLTATGAALQQTN